MASAVMGLATRLGLNKMKVWEGNFEKLGKGKSLYQLSAKTLEGESFDFASLKGKVVLITNVACLCGFTKSNYEQLVELDKKYAGKLAIMAFPSNEFGNQEPKGPAEIRQFVNDFGVKFQMMEKINVNGPNTHPVYLALKKATGSEDVDVKWNFETKFLVSKDGKQVERYSKVFEPKDLIPFIDRHLNELSTSARL